MLQTDLGGIDTLLVRDDDQDHGPYPDPPVDRREFLTSVTAFAIVGARAERANVVGDDHVDLVDATVRRIEAQDATSGGGNLFDEVVGHRWQVDEWLGHSSFPMRVGESLQGQVGELSAWAGWLAFDDDRRAEANYYIQDALTQARLADDPALEVRALSYLCLLARQQGRPRMSLQCAEAGLRLAKGWATPRLVALLHLRAAQGHASLGEASAFRKELAKATGQLDRGAHADDPLYIGFMTPQELTGLTGVSYLALGQPDRAAEAFLEVVDAPDPSRPRNVTYYKVRLAQALAVEGDISQASDVALDAVDDVAALASSRTTRRFAALRDTIEPHGATVPKAHDFVDAYDVTFA
jgi:hypothetical protein